MDVRIDPAKPDREPLPRPDLRSQKIAIGPVVVFGASNFPLAFSVAGGDTASALAAGCPVIVKGHPAHPGVCELISKAIAEAVQGRGLHEGVFSLLNGVSHELGAALVGDPRIKAVGFTGSQAGGLALSKIAASREEPIPVYAEMSAVNPVILMPDALAHKADDLAHAFVSSLTLGAGQFCTNPGIVFALTGKGLDDFTKAAAGAISGSEAQTMLTPNIRQNYDSGVSELEHESGVELIGRGKNTPSPSSCRPALFSVHANQWLASPKLAQEVFGASSLIVTCDSLDQLKLALNQLEGQLTATVHFTEKDEDAVRFLLPILEEKAGRLIANGWPTGVEVCHAMVHGGPFPATSDGRSTSVGSAAIDRFLRPVCYQDFPSSLLPDATRDGGAQPAVKRVDGQWVLR